MSIFKKFAAPLVAVALVATMGVSLISATRTAEAANSVTTRGLLTVSNITNRTNGTNASTVLTTQPILTAVTAATDIPSGTTVVVTAPTGYVISAQGTATGSATATLFGAGSVGTLAADGSTITYTTTANNGANETVTWAGLAVTPLTNSTTGGSITISIGAAAAVNLATITQTGALTATYVLTVTAPVASVTADGSQATTITAALRDSAGALVTNTPVVWTVSLGIVSTGTAKTAISVTGTNGNATQTYRGGGGVAATDTIIGSVSSLNVVGTLSMSLTAPSGTTAAKITITAPASLAIAPTVTNVSPGYVSPTIGTNFSVQSTDSASLGVNGQVILISVDKGALVAGFGGACAGVSTRAITGTTATGPLTSGGVNTSGVIAVTYCGNQTDASGQATITASNISTSMANATQTVSMAGRPAKITATVTGTSITATVTDANSNKVADGTPVRFTISVNAGATSTNCTTTSNGAASSVVALIAASGTVIVSSDYNETGTAATCAASGAQQIATSVVVGAGGTTPPVVTPPTVGAGTFASAPVYSSGKLAQVVYNGGTVAQLEAAVIAANGTGVWAQTSTGVFVLYIVNGGFVNDAFKAAFPTGFAGVTAVTVVGK